mgnify:CR=1 FL=1
MSFALLPAMRLDAGDCFEFYGTVQPISCDAASPAPIGCQALLATAVPATDLDVLEAAALQLLQLRHARVFAQLC